MRKLLILQGIPSSGKSSFVKSQGLEKFTVSSDSFRELLAGYEVKEGKIKISSKMDSKVWEMVYSTLESRFENQLFTVFDATNCDNKSVNKVISLANKHLYESFIVPFHVDLEEAIKRDKSRDIEKRVGSEVIERFFNKLQNFSYKEYNVLDQSSWLKSLFKEETLNAENYSEVFIFGDLQSCFYPLNQFFKENSFSEDNLYVFVADYFDRGIESREVAEFILKLSNHRNVLFLYGNHEYHLKNWVKNQKVQSEEFKNNSQPQIEHLKKDLSKFVNKMKDFVKIKFEKGEMLVSHSGLSFYPTEMDILKMSSKEFIFSKNYKEMVETEFEKNTSPDKFQVHGHRNGENREFSTEQRSFSLEGKIEYGGFLKVLRIYKGQISMLKFKNEKIKTFNDNSFLESLNSPFIKEKDLGNDIYSYNFTRKTFYRKEWNESTIKARGLFVHKPTRKIVARSYNKFFNVGEMESTKVENLNFNYPLNVYLKENGFLGILGFDFIRNDLFFASKSTNSGEFAELFKSIWAEANLDDRSIKMYLKEANVSFVFEVIDPVKDPHIIKYEERKIVLLDIIRNEPEFSNYSYQEVLKIGKKFKLETKLLHKTINCKEEFDQFWKESMEPSFLVNGNPVEGFVLEDSNKFMVKIKCDYYNFWKKIRSLKENRDFIPRTKKETEVIEFISKNDLYEMDVIQIADLFKKKEESDA